MSALSASKGVGELAGPSLRLSVGGDEGVLRARPELAGRVREALEAYYTPIYRDMLGLPDWKAHVEKRHHEDANFEAILDKAERHVIGRRVGPERDSRVLVVGGGTGADFNAFALRGCRVFAVEPSKQAVGAARLKAAMLGIDASGFVEGVGERLPFEDGYFDFVWTWTVLEHVQDVEMCLREISRVLRPGGEAYIGTVDYRQHYEPHYKTHVPCYLGKAATRLALRLKGRDPAFIDTLRFTNHKQVGRKLRLLPVVAMRAQYPWSVVMPRPTGVGQKVVRWITDTFDIPAVQHWLVRKLPLA
ncbi:MAG: methyltransferase domain-containing protein [Phycisphaerales bacterium]|nr:methyltransferase domain-containing protein [Phycisphaerales bacterium]